MDVEPAANRLKSGEDKNGNNQKTKSKSKSRSKNNILSSR
jgi:hypothetical protein